MSENKKSRMLSLRVTQEQFDYLERMARRIKERTGFRVTRASIVIKLMEYGVSHLEEEFPESNDKSKWWKKVP